MTWLYLIILLALMWVSVCVRLTVLHPFGVVVNTVRDLWNWFIHKEWRVYHGGKLNCYSAHFGGGKTLSMVHQSVFRDFKKYNNKMVWDRGRKKWVLQKVEILSNVHLSDVPYIYLTSLSQIVNRAMVNKKLDEENDTRTVTIVDLDEAATKWLAVCYPECSNAKHMIIKTDETYDVNKMLDIVVTRGESTYKIIDAETVEITNYMLVK